MATKPHNLEQDGPHNPELAAAAIRTVESTGTDPRRGMCQKMVREAIQSEYGDDYNRFHQGTAHDSMVAWHSSRFAVTARHGSVVGDILYKRGTRGNPAGHVGIRVPGNLVAENSSTRAGRVRGAYGFRTVEQFGKVDLIVRLPRRKK